MPVSSMVDLQYGHQLPPTVDLTQMDHYGGAGRGSDGSGGVDRGREHYERINLLEH